MTWIDETSNLSRIKGKTPLIYSLPLRRPQTLTRSLELGRNTMARSASWPFYRPWVDPSGAATSLVGTGVQAWLLCSCLFSSHCTVNCKDSDASATPEWGAPCWVISTMPSVFFSAVGRHERINFFSWPLWKDMARAWRCFSGRSPKTGVSNLCLLALAEGGAGLMATSPRTYEMKDSLPIMPSVHRLSV